MALPSLLETSQRPTMPGSITFPEELPQERVDPKSFQYKIKVAREEDAFVEKIAISNRENEEHGGLATMLHDISHSNLRYAEEAFKGGQYADASRHIENIHKAASAAASYG